MTSRIRNITFDSNDPWKIAQFWSAALGHPIHPENDSGDEEVGFALDPDGKRAVRIAQRRRARASELMINR